jgi:hypothetical protein
MAYRCPTQQASDELRGLFILFVISLLLFPIVVMAESAVGVDGEWKEVGVSRPSSDGCNTDYGTCEQRIMKDGGVQRKNCRYPYATAMYCMPQNRETPITTYKNLEDAERGVPM